MSTAHVYKAISGSALALIGLTPYTAGAQASALKAGLQGRIVEASDAYGVTPELDTNGQVKAGYYRIMVEDKGASNAAICPKVKFAGQTKDQQKAWKSTESEIYDKVFKRKVAWSITADIAVAVTGSVDAPIKTSLRLITIQNAESTSCNVSVGDPEKGIDYSSFFIPINRQLTNYGESAQVAFKASYSRESDQGRITNLWDGLSFVVSSFVPPARGVMDTLGPVGKSELTNLLDANPLASVTKNLSARPGNGQKGGAVFIDLGFFHSSPNVQTGTTLDSGVIIRVDYDASVFDSHPFYRPITTAPAKLLSQQMVVNGAPKAISDVLGAGPFATLKSAANPAGFDGGCGPALTTLTNAGLSETDATVFIWAVGMTNPNVRNALHTVECLTNRNDLLDLVGLKIVPPPPPNPTLVRASIDQIHAAFQDLNIMLKAGKASNSLTRHFAPVVQLVVDADARALLGLGSITAQLQRDELVALLTKNFAATDCFAPTAAQPDLQLPMRPAIQPLADQERVGAAAIQTKGDGPDAAYILAMRFDGTPEGSDLPLVTSISIMRKGTDAGPVVDAVTTARRPGACTAAWMDSIFN
jgi:hypothetical protein